MENGNVLRLPEWRYEDWWLRDLKIFRRRVAAGVTSHDTNNGSNDSDNGMEDGIPDAEQHQRHVLETLRIAEEVEMCCSSIDV